MYALFLIVIFALSPFKPIQNQDQATQAQSKTANTAYNTGQNLPALPQPTAPPTQQNTNRYDADPKPKLFLGLTRGEWVSSLLTLSYVVISLLAFFAIKKQANLTEEQAESGKEQFAKQITELTKSSNAMGQIATTIEQGNRDIMRAYLTVTTNNQATYQERRIGQPDLPFIANPVIFNTGNTPARKVCIRISANILKFPIPDNFIFPAPKNETKDAGIVGARISYTMAGIVDHFVPDAEVPAIKEGDGKALAVWGEVTYEDIYGRPHSTKFGQFVTWNPVGVEGYYIPGQNDAD